MKANSESDEGQTPRAMWESISMAHALEDPMERENSLKHSMESLTGEMAAKLLSNLNPDDFDDDAATIIFDRFATMRPSEAAAWTQGLPNLKSRQTFLNLAAMRWADTDLPQAADWSLKLLDSDGRSEVLAGVAAEAVRLDLNQAMRLAAEIPPGMAQSDLMIRIAAEWSGNDRDAAMNWAAQIEDMELRQLVFAQIVAGSADVDPAGAATIALQYLSPGPELDRAIVAVVQRWVQKNPADAISWVDNFPESELKRDAMASLMNVGDGLGLVPWGD